MPDLKNSNILYDKTVETFTSANGNNNFDFTDLADGLYYFSLYSTNSLRYLIMSLLINSNGYTGYIERVINIGAATINTESKIITVSIGEVEDYNYSLTKL